MSVRVFAPRLGMVMRRKMKSAPSKVSVARHKPRGVLRRKPKTKVGSKTTLTKKLNQESKMNSLQSGSESFVHYGFNKLKPAQYMAAKGVRNVDISTNWASSFFTGIGFQNSQIVNRMYTYADANEITNQLGFTNTATNPALQTSLGYGATAATLAHGINTWKSVSEIYLTNASNSPCIMTLYDVACRRVPTVNGRDDPRKLWDFVPSAEGSIYGTSADTIVGQTPFSSESFCKNYKIMKITHVQLAEGQIHRHVVTHKGRMYWQPWYDISQAVASGDTTAMARSLSFYTMCTVHGTPVAASANPITEITSSNIKINHMCKTTYTFRPVMNSNHYNLTRNNLLSSVTGGVTEVMQMYTGSTQSSLVA